MFSRTLRAAQTGGSRCISRPCPRRLQPQELPQGPRDCQRKLTLGAQPSTAASVSAGLIQPTLLGDGQVRVDMGPPTLAAADVPTTLEPTRPDGSVVAQVWEGRVQELGFELDSAGIWGQR